MDLCSPRKRDLKKIKALNEGVITVGNLPIRSMGLVYLHTFTIKINKCRSIYQFHGCSGNDSTWGKRAFFHNQDLISYNTLINACTLEMFVRCLVTWEFEGRNST